MSRRSRASSRNSRCARNGIVRRPTPTRSPGVCCNRRRHRTARIMADNTNQKSLSKLHYEARPAHVIAQIEALLRQLHAKALLNVPDPLRSARLFAALFKDPIS
jgi:AefR-like transcriptional repressor, C-terminal domain